VAAFLDGRIGFLDIAMIVEDVLGRYSAERPSTIGDVLAADARARDVACQVMRQAS
jgi:1-deoxy-D-xylulose-5-phosphate reductoisomerase